VKNSSRIFLSLIHLSLVAFFVASLAAFFSFGLKFIIHLNVQYTFLIYLLPLALFVTLLVEKNLPQWNERLERNWRSELWKDGSTLQGLLLLPLSWMSHFVGASVGREGVAVQLGRSSARIINAVLPQKIRSEDAGLVARLGVAAGFSAVFGTPVTASVFAFEWLAILPESSRNLRSFVACLFCAVVAHQCAVKVFFVQHDTLSAAAVAWSLRWILFLVVLSLFAAVLARFHVYLLNRFSAQAELFNSSLWRRALLGGGALAVLFSFSAFARYKGLGVNLINESFMENASSSMPFNGFDWALKSLFTSFSLAVGFKGGEVTPLFAMGVTLAHGLAQFFLVPVAAAAAVGFALVFSIVLRVPISGAVLALELFGFNPGLAGASVCLFPLLLRYRRHA